MKAFIAAFVIGAAVFIYIVVLLDLVLPTDDSDAGKFNRSGFEIHTDSKTGCQYFSGMFFGISPRYDGNGGIVGCKK